MLSQIDTEKEDKNPLHLVFVVMVDKQSSL